MKFKRILFIFICFFGFILSSFAEENPSFNQELLITGSWFTEKDLLEIQCRIIFDENGTYTFFSALDRFELAIGKYVVTDNGIILQRPEQFYTPEEDSFFPKNVKSIKLVYKQKSTFYYLNEDVLESEDKNINYCISSCIGKKSTPQGTKCLYDNIEVIKITKKFTPVENLKIRKKPSLSAETGEFNYTSYLYWGSRSVIYDNGYNYTGDPEIAKNEKYLSLILKGMLVYSEAQTVEKQTIDGITAPWYLITLNNNDGITGTESFWVFGGYLKQTFQTDEDYSLLLPELEKKGVIIKK